MKTLNGMTLEELETALDLTWLSMSEPCLEEDEFVVETSYDKELKHFALLQLIEMVKRGE